MQDSEFYTDFITQLLYLESVDEIQRAVRDIPGLEADKLYQAINSLAAKLLEEGRTTEHNLLTFVKTAINSVFKEKDENTPLDNEITKPEELLQLALAAPTAIRVYTILRKHQHLLSKRLYDDIEKRISFNQRTIMHPSSSEVARWVKLLCVLSLLLDDKAITVRGYLFWSAHCRRAERYRNASRWLKRAAKLSEDLDDAFLRVSVLSVQGSLYERMGEQAWAAEVYSKALEIAEDSDQELVILNIRLALAGCYRSLGRCSEALEHVDAYLSMAQELQLPLEEMDCRLLKGLLLEDMGRYEKSVAEYEKAEALAKSLGERGKQFEAMNHIAASFLQRGNHRKSLEQFKSVFRTVERWENPIMIASTHNNLGTVLLQMGRPDKALGEFSKALGVKMKSGTRYGEAVSLCGMGDSLLELGKRDQAETFYQLMLIPALESNDLRIWHIYASRMLDEGFDIGDDNEKMIRSIRETFRQKGRMLEELSLSSLLAEHYLRQGNEPEALALYQEAIERGKAHDERSSLVMHLQVNFAKLLAKKSDRRQEAYSLLTNTLAAVEEHLREVLLDRRRGEIIAEWIDLYGTLINLLIEGSEDLRLPNFAVPHELAFNLHEAAKSRSFIASLADTAISPPASIPQALQEREAHLLKLERSLQDHEANEEVQSETYRLERLRKIRNDLQACWEDMKPFAPEYVQLRLGEIMTLQACKSLLSSQADSSIAFVSFFCDRDSTTCFVIRSDEEKLHVFRSNINRQELLVVAQSLRRAFNGAPDEFPPYPRIRRDKPWKRNLSFFENLSEELLKFLPAVQGAQLLCIAPHGPLHLLPLHALRTPDGKFLIERFACTYFPSFSTLSYCQAGALPMSIRKPSVYIAGIASRKDKKPEFLEQDNKIFDKSRWNITADIGTELATKKRVLQQLNDSDYNVVHLTCHGYFDEQDPLNSGLLFSDGSKKPPLYPKSISILDRNRYLITARDLLRTRIDKQLMTLRACSTGIQAERNAGDEFEGISRSLLYAGNASIIVSLWNVDQESSQKLLAKFYRYWNEPGRSIPKWRAFWQTQLDFIADIDEQFLCHPYHWAPFILIGDWR